MKITAEQLKAMIPGNQETEAWAKELNKAFKKYDIDTPERIAGFISQAGHESNDFKALEENLNYSEKALNSVFGRYFGEGKRDAAEYARNPEKIANYVYMDEYRSKKGALGNTEEGDGWRFRGRGLKQLTGRNNYTAFAKDFDMTAEEAAKWVETKEGALASALWFWDKRNLNNIADTGDVAALTKKINGGDIGLRDRKERYARCMSVLNGTYKPGAVSILLKIGSTGEAVKKVQRVLRQTPDGVFGKMTDKAVRAWQADNGLKADGIVGPKTYKRMTR